MYKTTSECVRVALDVELNLIESIRLAKLSIPRDYAPCEIEFLENRTLRILREENNKHYGEAMHARRKEAEEWFNGIRSNFSPENHPCT